MASHSFVVESHLSVADAYARLIDLERVPEWDEGIISSVRLPGDEARYELTLTGFDGRPAGAVYEVTEATVPERFVMVGRGDQFEAVDTLELTPTDSGSSLNYHGTLELTGDDAPLTEQQLDSMFPKIAAVAEAGLISFLNP